tara:strand:+ start:129 stop:308 length:180 start_codon:yes stop_codon:yes gene_type:complete
VVEQEQQTLVAVGELVVFYKLIVYLYPEAPLLELLRLALVELALQYQVPVLVVVEQIQL